MSRLYLSKAKVSSNNTIQKKWGYKVFVCSGISGIIHDLEIYTGKIEVCPGQPDLGASGNIVLKLLQNVPRDMWHKIFIDNWFNSIPLQITLWKQGIACLGTVRGNRLKGCSFPSDKELAKSGRGQSLMKTTTYDDVTLKAVKWTDNKSVTMLSTYAGILPSKTVSRFDKKQKTTIDVECPSVITIYNAFMGGVDLLNSLVALYRNPIKSKKWYHKIVFHLFDLFIVQSWLLYVDDCKQEGCPHMPLLQFKLNIAQCLVQERKKPIKRGRPSVDLETKLQQKKKKSATAVVPPQCIRTDQIAHYPMAVDQKGRCKYPTCNGYSRTMCEKCNVHLCLNKHNNCFKKFSCFLRHVSESTK